MGGCPSHGSTSASELSEDQCLHCVSSGENRKRYWNGDRGPRRRPSASKNGGSCAFSAAQAQPVTVQARRGAGQVQAIVTDGETGEVTPDVNLTFTTVDVPGAVVTSIQGVNTAGDMVGFHQDVVNGQYHAFVLREGKFTLFDYPAPPAPSHTASTTPG